MRSRGLAVGKGDAGLYKGFHNVLCLSEAKGGDTKTMEQNIPDEVMKEVEAKLEETLKDHPRGMGFCHVYWNYKKRYLADRGYDWKSPQDLEPNTIFD